MRLDYGYDDDFRLLPGTPRVVRLRWLIVCIVFTFGALLACAPAR